MASRNVFAMLPWAMVGFLVIMIVWMDRSSRRQEEASLRQQEAFDRLLVSLVEANDDFDACVRQASIETHEAIACNDEMDNLIDELEICWAIIDIDPALDELCPMLPCPDDCFAQEPTEAGQ